MTEENLFLRGYKRFSLILDFFFKFRVCRFQSIKSTVIAVTNISFNIRSNSLDWHIRKDIQRQKMQWYLFSWMKSPRIQAFQCKDKGRWGYCISNQNNYMKSNSSASTD